MFRKTREKFSVLLSKAPGRLVVLAILLFNVVFFLISAAIIKALSLSGTETMSFWEAVYYTVTMVLDAGCIESVITEVGAANVALVIICIVVIMIGMILFTGAVIGYVTNYISGFIDNANGGNHKVYMSNHTVIINWNSRASEIVNDLLYKRGKQKVVVLAPSGKDKIEKELSEQIEATIAYENEQLKEKIARLPKASRRAAYKKGKIKNNLLVIVREGDTFSSKQLNDVSLAQAKSIIILGNDLNDSTCKFQVKKENDSRENGNQQTIKTLMQVADITGAKNSADDQKIIVEVEDDWTLKVVNMIIESKQVEGKCNIVPVSVNYILGRLLSQFSLMPELNAAYTELLSNKGVTFYAREVRTPDEEEFMENALKTRDCVIPLTVMENKGKYYGYYDAQEENFADIISSDKENVGEKDYSSMVKLNRNYHLSQRNVVVLGHNGKLKYIMDGFDSFRKEWGFKDGREIMNVIVIDNKSYLEKMNYFRDYPYVKDVVEAEIYEHEKICNKIESFVDENEGDTSILVLSDDAVPSEEIDAHTVTNLVYIRDIIRKKKLKDPSFAEGKIDVIVEIINPKNYDVIKNYNVKNVVISNRYISKMIGQLGDRDVLFDFYNDILTFDDASEGFSSKELYVKRVNRFFDEVPAKRTARELVRAVYFASADKSLPEDQRTRSVILGYVKADGEVVLFSGDLNKTEVELTDKDKLIMFATH